MTCVRAAIAATLRSDDSVLHGERACAELAIAREPRAASCADFTAIAVPAEVRQRACADSRNAHCAASRLLLDARARARDDFPIYLFIFIVFLNRYVFGLYLTLRHAARSSTRRSPATSRRSRSSCRSSTKGRRSTTRSSASSKLDYPRDKLEVIVVDDCSTDDSYEWACKAARELPERHACCATRTTWASARASTTRCASRRAEIIVSVDSDVIVVPDRAARAGRALHDAARSPRSAAASTSRTRTRTGSRKLQTIKYYFGQEHLKNLERALESVMCLSGCLTAYRRHVLIELEPILENRNILGVADQVRRGPLPHAPDRQARLPHAHDDGRDVLHEGARRRCAATSTSSCAGSARTSSTSCVGLDARVAAAPAAVPAVPVDAAAAARLPVRDHHARRSSGEFFAARDVPRRADRACSAIDLLLRAVACARCRRGCACTRSRSCRWRC